jgi:simple sugar transport system permease protein
VLKKLLVKREAGVSLAIIFIAALIQMRSGYFFTVANFVDIVRTAMIPGMMALGCFMVIVSGGFDMSFASIGALSMYVPMNWIITANYNGPIIVPFALCMIIGFACGSVNALISNFLRIDTFITSLCTTVIYKGIMLGVLRANVKTGLPEQAIRLSALQLFRLEGAGNRGDITLTALSLVFFVLIVIVFFILKYTRLGRGVFAIGGNRSAAVAAGYNVLGIEIFIYGCNGMFASMSVFISTLLMQTIQPLGYAHMAMLVISMVVVGGTSLEGGHGSLGGALLGVLLVTIIQSSLIMIGVPSYFQMLATGLFILAGAGMSGYRMLRREKMAANILDRLGTAAAKGEVK